MSFSVLHLYDQADFRKVGPSTCIRRRRGSGLCRWMMPHSPLSTFFTLFPKQWHHMLAALIHLLVLSAGLQLYALSAVLSLVSAHSAQSSFQTRHFIYASTEHDTFHLPFTMVFIFNSPVLVVIECSVPHNHIEYIRC